VLVIQVDQRSKLFMIKKAGVLVIAWQLWNWEANRHITAYDMVMCL